MAGIRMTATGSALAGALLTLAAGVALVGGVGLYGQSKFREGHEAAMTAGELARAEAYQEANDRESALRLQLLEKEIESYAIERQHATALADAQRRIRAGADSLRCPAALPASLPTDDRPAASGSAGDGAGPAIVPEAAADILGIAADVAGLVRRLERTGQRFDDCRALTQ